MRRNSRQQRMIGKQGCFSWQEGDPKCQQSRTGAECCGILVFVDTKAVATRFTKWRLRRFFTLMPAEHQPEKPRTRRAPAISCIQDEEENHRREGRVAGRETEANILQPDTVLGESVSLNYRLLKTARICSARNGGVAFVAQWEEVYLAGLLTRQQQRVKSLYCSCEGFVP